MCCVVTQVLAKAGGLEWEHLQKLREVQEELGLSQEEVLGRVEEVLHPEPYSREEVCSTLGITPQQLNESILSTNTQQGESIFSTNNILSTNTLQSV